MDLNRRLPRVDASRFSMVPGADVPRSKFKSTHTHKSTFNASYLIPIELNEVLPGDVHQVGVNIFVRLATPVFPLMDNLWLNTEFFFVPSRLVWNNHKKMMGERSSPSDSISYIVPTKNIDASAAACSIYDYFGIPVTGQIAGGQDLSVNALPLRAYNLIWNEWYRDQNLQNPLTVQMDDGPDATTYDLVRRNKRHDYFTSCLPWPLKGGTETSIPLNGYAPVRGIGVTVDSTNAVVNNLNETGSTPGNVRTGVTFNEYWQTSAAGVYIEGFAGAARTPQIFADLSTATGATINALRLAFQTQRLLERDARSGTRYTEILRAHFGVEPEDMRLQRPEYIGGGKTMFSTQAIPQTSAQTPDNDDPLGTLGATMLANDRHSYTLRATEHGYIIGLASVQAEITYQQGLHKLWSRRTRYDFYWPVFANLGEQSVLRRELYATGDETNDDTVFGYQERWAEYRHRPSRISGMYRSTTTLNIDEWHLAEHFGSAPALNSAFIEDKTYEVLQRILSAGTNANNMQVLFDSVFESNITRPMPMFSVPGMIDRL